MVNMLSKIGFFAFIAGLIVCVVAGFVSAQNAAVVIILIILGLIVGLLNITAKETMLFLVAAIALIVAGLVFAPFTFLDIGKYLNQILSYVATLVAPAAVVVAVKALWHVGKSRD